MNYGLTWEKKPKTRKDKVGYTEGEYTRIWLAVDRNKNEVIDFEVGDGKEKTAFKLFDRIYQRHKVKYVCTDQNPVYKTLINSFNLEKDQKNQTMHIPSKSETCLAESKNSSLRDNLARLNRRTKRISKSD